MKHIKHPNVFGPGQELDTLTDYLYEAGNTKSDLYNQLSRIYSLGFMHGFAEFKRKATKKINKITDAS